jgi:Na+-transporting NADH:ubiquinone oxidoreductase subunit C
MPNKESNGYIFAFSAVLVLIVSLLLTFIYQATKESYQRSVVLEKRQNILVAATGEMLTREEAGEQFDQYIVEMVAFNINGEVMMDGSEVFDIDLARELKKPAEEMLHPVFIYQNGDVRRYVVAMRGNGLWGPIWGYLAVESDFMTVANAVFDHKGETPGLGAEIKTAEFQDQFKPNGDERKLIASLDGKSANYLGVVKPGRVDPSSPEFTYVVEGISGGTITSDGVDAMLARFLAAFRNYVEVNISSSTTQPLLEVGEDEDFAEDELIEGEPLADLSSI